MDPELRRYLNGIFVLLVANVGANLSGSVTGVTDLFFWLVLAGFFGVAVYELFVRSYGGSDDGRDG